MTRWIFNEVVYAMLTALSWIGSKTMKLVDRFARPVTISNEEMEKARKDILEAVERQKVNHPDN